MTTTKITPNEWEAISAYLDGQLDAPERTRLEASLQSRSDLRAALDDMRRTRIILRSQPRLRAPRNFTLTPQMVGQTRLSRPAPRPFTFFRLASAMAGLVFVLVLIADLFSFGPALPNATGQVAMAPAAEIQAVEAPAAMELRSAAPEASPGADVQAFDAAVTEEAVVGAAEATGPEVTGTEESMPMAAAAPEEPSMKGAPPTLTPTPTAEGDAAVMMQQAPEAAPTEVAGGAGVSGVPEMESNAAEQPGGAADTFEAGEAQPAQPPAEQVVPGQPEPFQVNREALRIIEVATGLLALVFGLLAYWLHRSRGGSSLH